MGDLGDSIVALQGTKIPVDFKVNPILIPSETIRKLETYAHGSGGLGDIWKCSMSTESETHDVAVKSMRVLNLVDEENLRRVGWKIRREAYVWINLLHDHILPFKGIVDDFGPLPALVSPWMENGSLNDYLKEEFSKLSDIRKLELVQQVASGLSYLHSKDVVHGDLTGTNILVDGSGNLRLGDFGLSMVVAEAGNLTFSSLTSGNTRWMAPEFVNFPDEGQEQTSMKPTKTGDIYSFGCVMLQILSGEEPYGWIKTAVQVIAAIVVGRAPFNKVAIDKDQAHGRLSLRCLSRIPEGRPSIVEITTTIVSSK